MQCPQSNLRDSPGTTSNSLLASLALPDSYRVSLDSILAAECADVSGVLCDFHLLDLFSERSTVSVDVCQKCSCNSHRYRFRLTRVRLV
jgi:hypothetical protein